MTTSHGYISTTSGIQATVCIYRCATTAIVMALFTADNKDDETEEPEDEAPIKVSKPKKEWKYDPEIIVMESTLWLDSEEVQLDKYHSDINMVVCGSLLVE